MKRNLSFVFFAFLSILAVAQTPEWIVYGAIPINATRSAIIDDSLHTWVATFGGGVSVLTDQAGTYRTYTNTNSGLPDNNTTCVSIDSTGNYWIGTYSAGAVMFDGTTWTPFNNTNGLPGNNISCITIEDDNTKWFGIKYNGVTSYDGSTFSTWKTTNSALPNNNVNCITIDDAGNKWIGTYAGLAKFDGTNWTVYTVGSTAADNQVYSIVIESETSIWIGTGGGIWNFDGNATWINYNTSNSELPYDYVACLALDLQGNIWAGTTQGGLAMFDKVSAWTVYNTSNSLIPDMDIRAISIDTNNNKWIATNYGGLAFYGIQVTTDIKDSETGTTSPSVFPNPSKSNIEIHVNGVEMINARLTLFDVLGNNVLQMDQPESTQEGQQWVINRNNLSKGIYIFKISNSSKSMHGKLVLE